MTFDELKTKLASTVDDSEQRKQAVASAVAMVETGLKALSGFGHLFDVVEGTGPAPVEWPKAFYHRVYGFKTADGPDEANALLADGWKDKPVDSASAPEPVPEPVSSRSPRSSRPVPVSVDIAAAVASGQVRIDP